MMKVTFLTKEMFPDVPLTPFYPFLELEMSQFSPKTAKTGGLWPEVPSRYQSFLSHGPRRCHRPSGWKQYVPLHHWLFETY